MRQLHQLSLRFYNRAFLSFFGRPSFSMNWIKAQVFQISFPKGSQSCNYFPKKIHYSTIQTIQNKTFRKVPCLLKYLMKSRKSLFNKYFFQSANFISDKFFVLKNNFPPIFFFQKMLKQKFCFKKFNYVYTQF